jgi:hypothetical protein
MGAKVLAGTEVESAPQCCSLLPRSVVAAFRWRAPIRVGIAPSSVGVFVAEAIACWAPTAWIAAESLEAIGH